MARIFVFLGLLIATPCVAGSVPQATLLGEWCAGASGAFHEEFSLTIEGDTRVFSSWLHHRPAGSGTWELRDRTLTIRENSGDVTVYTIIKVTKKKLIVRRPDEPAEVYVRDGCTTFDPR